MTHIAYFEPAYVAHNQRDWEIRGSYKYPSLLGDLHKQARISLVMRTPPPMDDPHRQRLENEFGVRFEAIDALDDVDEHAVDMLTEDLSIEIERLAPDIVSTLNGRMIGHNFALANAARATGTEYVYRIAGNDIVTQLAVREAAGRPVSGTAYLATLVAQERYAADVARSIIVMGGTERQRVSRLVANPDKIHICRRGVDRSHFVPRDTAPDQCRKILFLGRNSAEKGIDLIEATAAHLAETRPDIMFTIAGDFSQRSEGNRLYEGFFDYAALPDLYRENHALLLPARSEGFPQVVMEAMTCGLPVILPQTLFNEDFGPEDGAALTGWGAEEVANVIAKWHDDARLFAAERNRALTFAEQHFDESVNGQRYHAVLLGQATA